MKNEFYDIVEMILFGCIFFILVSMMSVAIKMHIG